MAMRFGYAAKRQASTYHSRIHGEQICLNHTGFLGSEDSNSRAFSDDQLRILTWTEGHFFRTQQLLQ
jgi:hypothetical protein